MSLCFNSHFPDGPGLAGSRTSPFWILLQLRTMEVMVTTEAIGHGKLRIIITRKRTSSYLHARCPSCRPTNSVRALKEDFSKAAVQKNSCLGFQSVLMYVLMPQCNSEHLITGGPYILVDISPDLQVTNTHVPMYQVFLGRCMEDSV